MVTPADSSPATVRVLLVDDDEDDYILTRSLLADLGTGRVTPDGDAPELGETAWVCPRHKDRLATINRGRLFCRLCGRPLDDAIKVPWPPPHAPK